ncbi:psbQ-like protein 3, chloroplastic [Actinidia eriantha]|uniref:psbQ-like protein 3, chloroplastic n=1 Tax=Actinidia eriantha TaxID=165200 RepID=UPI00258D01E1|nr:psbQ-like protein 3, chloroplastic [Actinidia eriantha]
MALLAPTLHFKTNTNHPKTTFTCHFKPPSFLQKNTPQPVPSLTRRSLANTALFGSLLAAKNAFFKAEKAKAFDFRMTVPDQTLEEAESAISGHAQSLLQVKELLEESSWREAQKALRQSASSLKQDIYTIIQSKPGSERPQLRKLYSNLFNSVTGLDYAARDKDATRVWECYGNIVVALNEILSNI